MLSLRGRPVSAMTVACKRAREGGRTNGGGVGGGQQLENIAGTYLGFFDADLWVKGPRPKGIHGDVVAAHLPFRPHQEAGRNPQRQQYADQHKTAQYDWRSFAVPTEQPLW